MSHDPVCACRFCAALTKRTEPQHLWEARHKDHCNCGDHFREAPLEHAPEGYAAFLVDLPVRREAAHDEEGDGMRRGTVWATWTQPGLVVHWTGYAVSFHVFDERAFRAAAWADAARRFALPEAELICEFGPIGRPWSEQRGAPHADGPRLRPTRNR